MKIHKRLSGKSNGAVIAIAAVTLLICVGIAAVTMFGSSSDMELTAEDAAKKLDKLYGKITVSENHAPKGTVSYGGSDAGEELPDIDTAYPITVENTTGFYIEIFSSPEKAGTGTDGWLCEIADNFNDARIQINGKTASVAVRSISSGAMVDYIESGRYVPDAFTPSNSFWGSMISANGVDIRTVSDRLVGNCAGILLSQSKLTELTEKYGQIDMQTITSATEAEEIAMGYTNPFASSTGLNFLVSTLYSYDSGNLLSSTAVDGFNRFQANVPFVAYTTIQMREAAESGSFDGFILEYQSYANDTELKRNYVFNPYGVRHDNPLYAMANLPEDKAAIVDEFAAFCLSTESQQLASSYGFNGMNDYTSTMPEPDGNTLTQAQKIWKENKNSAKPIAAVFVLDTSGSMSGEPISELKKSLTNSISYINSTNYVGVVSYSDNVNIELPIGKFDLNQQSYFQGAVDSLNASGNTATYDAVVVGLKMLEDFSNDNPNVQPVLFVLSDGMANKGSDFNDISGVLKTYSVPVYTIGYNADLDELGELSSVNEAACINADTDDVVYKLKNLFNANL